MYPQVVGNILEGMYRDIRTGFMLPAKPAFPPSMAVYPQVVGNILEGMYRDNSNRCSRLFGDH
jgi:hypothetical protein